MIVCANSSALLQVIGSVNTTLSTQYGKLYTESNAYSVVSAIAFAGTVVGQLFFGFLSDHWSRTNSLLISTVILIVFTILATASYYHGDPVGMFNILTAYRFLVGIGIGGEYPAGSVGCAESSGELKEGTRNRWFILFTNSMIDWGFVLGAFVPCTFHVPSLVSIPLLPSRPPVLTPSQTSSRPPATTSTTAPSGARAWASGPSSP